MSGACLDHLPDLWKGSALACVAALLAAGGVLLVRDLVFSVEPHEAEERLEAWLAAVAPSAERGWTRAELELHLRSEHSTFSWLLEPLLEHAGFEIREAAHRQHAYSTYVCAKPR